MRNYLKAELFRNFHRKYLWGYIACVIGVGLLGCLGFKYMNYHYENTQLTLETVIYIGITIIPSYMLLMMLFTDLAMGEEFKNSTIKNIGSSGLPRVKIYICKVIESIIFMIFSTLISFISIVIAGYLILGINDSVECISALKDCLVRGMISVMLWAGGITIAQLLSTLIKGETVVSFIYVGIIMFMGDIFDLLGHYITPIFTHLQKYLLTTQLNQIASIENLSTQIVSTALITGVVYIVVAIALGTAVLQRKDI